MSERKKYLKREKSQVIAVQLDLETPGFSYRKWGHEQRCKAQDWIVNNNGEVYTIDKESFAKTYRQVSPGLYQKFGPVWAEVAASDGSIQTKEGTTTYKAGAYIVFNDEDGNDGYAVEQGLFEEMYEPLQ